MLEIKEIRKTGGFRLVYLLKYEQQYAKNTFKNIT